MQWGESGPETQHKSEQDISCRIHADFFRIQFLLGIDAYVFYPGSRAGAKPLLLALKKKSCCGT